jgi:hypothetical protein
MDERTLSAELAEKNIRMRDCEAWTEALTQWQKQGLVINPNDRFSDVVETVFIKHLEAIKA